MIKRKNKKGSNGYIIGILIIIFMFMSYMGMNESTLRNAGYEENISTTACLSALISIEINTLCICFEATGKRIHKL